MKGESSRDEADADFLVEHLQDLLARAALEQLAMHLQALNRFSTALCGPKIHRAVFGWVILPRFCEFQYDVLDLRVQT